MFASIGAAISANALKYGLIALVAVGLLGGGFVWGDMHATKNAVESSVKDADARVSSLTKAYQDQIASYAKSVSAQQARADELAKELDATKSQLASAGASSKEKISHDVPTAVVCDLPSNALSVLRNQAARN